MAGIKWNAFILSNTLVKSIVHFFPNSGGVTAPYPANCKLSLWGEKLPRQQLTLEGARVSQPDGVALEDAFPVLKGELTGLFGIEVELTGTQARADLGQSGCIIEFYSKVQTVRYRARSLEQYQNQNSAAVGFAIKDPFLCGSIIVMNGSQNQVKPAVYVAGKDSERTFLSLDAVAPQTVTELPFAEQFLSELPAQELSWGLTRAAPIYFEKTTPDVKYFILYRDAGTKRPVSVDCII